MPTSNASAVEVAEQAYRALQGQRQWNTRLEDRLEHDKRERDALADWIKAVQQQGTER